MKMNMERKKEKERDRISDLPDHILSLILTLVSIKTAVQSCVLSKRWRYIWKSLPIINFDHKDFPIYDRYTVNPTFTNFVSQFLSLRENIPVREFYFSVPFGVDRSFLNNCVCYAACHNVQEIGLHAWCCFLGSPNKNIFEYPPCFLTSQSLTVLDLDHPIGTQPLPKSFTLPTVKTLRLTRYWFDVHGGEFGFSSATDPFSNFPNVENLVLHYCGFINTKISAPLLRTLEIVIDQMGYLLHEHSIIVSTPRLTSLRVESNVSISFSKEVLPCLDNLYVDLYPRLDVDLQVYTKYIEEKMSRNLVQTLEQMENVNFVKLSMSTVKVLEMYPGSLDDLPSPFNNLKHINFIASRGYSFFPVPSDVLNYFGKGSLSREEIVVEYPKVKDASLEN